MHCKGLQTEMFKIQFGGFFELIKRILEIANATKMTYRSPFLICHLLTGIDGVGGFFQKKTASTLNERVLLIYI